MGMVFALFMNAMEYRDIEMIGNVRQSTKKALRVYILLIFNRNIKNRKISKEC